MSSAAYSPLPVEDKEKEFSSLKTGVDKLAFSINASPVAPQNVSLREAFAFGTSLKIYLKYQAAIFPAVLLLALIYGSFLYTSFLLSEPIRMVALQNAHTTPRLLFNSTQIQSFPLSHSHHKEKSHKGTNCDVHHSGAKISHHHSRAVDFSFVSVSAHQSHILEKIVNFFHKIFGLPTTSHMEKLSPALQRQHNNHKTAHKTPLTKLVPSLKKSKKMKPALLTPAKESVPLFTPLIHGVPASNFENANPYPEAQMEVPPKVDEMEMIAPSNVHQMELIAPLKADQMEMIAPSKVDQMELIAPGKVEMELIAPLNADQMELIAPGKVEMELIAPLNADQMEMIAPSKVDQMELIAPSKVHGHHKHKNHHKHHGHHHYPLHELTPGQIEYVSESFKQHKNLVFAVLGLFLLCYLVYPLQLGIQMVAVVLARVHSGSLFLPSGAALTSIPFRYALRGFFRIFGAYILVSLACFIASFSLCGISLLAHSFLHRHHFVHDLCFHLDMALRLLLLAPSWCVMLSVADSVSLALFPALQTSLESPQGLISSMISGLKIFWSHPIRFTMFPFLSMLMIVAGPAALLFAPVSDVMFLILSGLYINWSLSVVVLAKGHLFKSAQCQLSNRLASS